MEIHLDSGDVLSLTPEQTTSLQAYIDHPNNLVPAYDPITTMTVHVPRWASIDEWVEWNFNTILSGALSLVPPPGVVVIQEQLDALNTAKRKALEPVKS